MRVTWKKGQLTPDFDFTITILNKLSGRDTPDRIDQWKKTVLHNCSWSTKAVSAMSGASVLIGGTFVSQIPKSPDYRPYKEWKDNMDGWTVSTGDYVIKGEIGEDDIAAQNVRQIVDLYRPEAFEVRAFQDATGAIEALGHYRLEGV